MQDRPLLGIALMLGFCLMAPIGDSLAKLLGQSLPLGLLLLARFAVQTGALLPLVLLTPSFQIPTLTHGLWALLWARAALHIIGIGAMFTALRFLPLADAVAIAFVMPFLMLGLGHLVLGEEIGRRRLIACLVGFTGTLLVVQPAFDAVGWPAVLPLLVAVVFSLFMLITRMMAKKIDPIALQSTNGIMALVLLAPLITLAHLLTEASTYAQVMRLVLPTLSESLMLLAIGLTGTLAHLLMSWSLRYAPAATLAPMQYLEIPFAVVFGWLIFSDWPNALASLGIVITLAAGLYIVMRERAMSRPDP